MNNADAPNAWSALTLGEFNQLLSSYPPGRCWAANLYLGSTFVLDFGERLLVNGSRGSFYQGTTSVGIRNCYWELRREVQIVSADNVNKESFNNSVTPMLRGQLIEGVEHDASRGFLRFSFSNDIAIALDTTNRWETDSAIAEIGLSNGAYVEILPSGQLQSSTDRDLLRLHVHESRSLKTF